MYCTSAVLALATHVGAGTTSAAREAAKSLPNNLREVLQVGRGCGAVLGLEGLVMSWRGGGR